MKRTFIRIIILFIASSVEIQAQIDWQRSGYTTLEGRIQNFEKYYDEHNTVEIQIDDWTNAYRRTIFTEIDSFGNFSLSCFIFQTQEIILRYKNEWRYVFVTPDDTLRVVIDADAFGKTCSITAQDSIDFSYDPEASFYGLKYSGVTAKICQNYDHFSASSLYSSICKHVSVNKEKVAELSFQRYTTWRDSVYEIQQIILNEFLEANHYDEFSNQFLKSRFYLSYIYDLFNYYSILNDHYQWNDSIRIRHSLNLVNTKMKEDYKLLMANPEFYFTVINSHISGLIGEIGYQEFRDSYSEAALDAEFTEQKEKITPLNELSSQDYVIAKFPFVLKAADAIEDDRIRQSLIAHNYTMTLEYRNVDPGLDLALSRITNEEIKASMINARNHFLWRTSHLNAINFDPEGDTLLNHLKEKYKDHVLYIDFWGTWCGACYGNFEAMPALKEKLKGKEVTFVYLCCNCDEDKWTETIDSYALDGEHIFLSSEQYAHLATKFNLIGVPKFIIIDRKGKIVNDRAPRPENHPLIIERVANEILKYLN
jgi:thiol-disulfide isomerase/thioredoxin